MTLPAGHVRLYAEDGSDNLIAELDEQIPSITSGYGGFEATPIPKRPARVDWEGVEPYRMTFGVLFDGWAASISVEPQCQALERMGRDPGGDKAPPILRAEGPLPRSAGVRWHIESLGWGDRSLRRRGDQARVRQQVTIVLVQHTDDDRLRPIRRAKPRSARTHVWRKGDKLTSLAGKYLGAGKRWREIAKLNKIADPRKIKVGRKLRIPER